MTFHAPVDPLLVLALSGFALGSTVLAYRGVLRSSYSASTRVAGTSLSLIRVAAIVGVSLIGLGPTAHRLEPAGKKSGVVHLLVDGSASMCVDDVVLERVRSTRSEIANRWIKEALDSGLANSIRLHRIGDEWRPLDATARVVAPADDASRLVDQTRRVIRLAHPGDELLLVTDGHDTTQADWMSIADEANARDLIVHTVSIGRDDPSPDLAVRLSPDRSSVFRDQSLTLRGDIRRRGFDGREVSVALYQNDRLVDRRKVRLDDRRTPLEFSVTPTPFDESSPSGLCAYRVEVAPLPGERWTANNTRHAFVRVNAERIRVLLFENEPYWDTRYLTAALRRDTQIELTTVIGLGPSERITQYAPGDVSDWAGAPLDTPPVTPEALARFDVIVLGRGVERWFPGRAAEALATFVQVRGGAIVFARGRPVGADASGANGECLRMLESIAPVRWSGERASVATIEVTPQGRSRPPLNFGSLGEAESILTELPGLVARTRVDASRALSETWLQSRGGDGVDANAALIATIQSGNGRTLAVLSDGLWKWSMIPPQLDSYRSVYDMFWARTVRWLVGAADLLPGQEIALTVDRTTAAPGDPIQIIATMRFSPPDQSAPVATVISPSGVSTRLTLASQRRELARFVGEFVAEEEGVHQVELDLPAPTSAPATTRFAVYASSLERLETSSRPEELRSLADATGGHSFAHDAWGAFVESMRRTDQSRVEIPRFVDIWPRWWVLAALLGLFSCEWLIRRRLGWS